MADTGGRAALVLLLCGVWPVLRLSTAQDPGLYEVVTVDQCYSKPIPVRCSPGFMVRVLTAHHRQTEKCKASFHDAGCVAEEKGNPACVGNTTCMFKTPWMYLSATCGYSNNFQIAYQCVPVNIQQDVCATPVIQGQVGYLISPNYPKKYPVSQNCSTTIRVHPLHHVRVYILDLFLAYYTTKGERRCVDKVWLEDAGGLRRSEEICAGHERAIVFVSTTNEAVVRFESAVDDVKNAKGFWLYYEAFDPAQEPDATTPYAITRTTTTTTTTTVAPTTRQSTTAEEKDTKSTPWYFRYTNVNIDKSEEDVDNSSGTSSSTKYSTAAASGSSRQPADGDREGGMGGRGPKRPMVHRIYGIVKEESNWAPSTIPAVATTTTTTTTAATAVAPPAGGGRPTGGGGGGGGRPQTPRPKVSRGKHLRTSPVARTLNDLQPNGMVPPEVSSTRRSEAKVRRHQTLEAKKPSWIDEMGKEYIAAISTGAGGLIILLGVICGLIANVKRKRKQIQPPQMPVTTKKPYNNVILAYTGEDGPPAPGVPNLGYDEDARGGGPQEVNGFSNPHFSTGGAPWLQLSGLLPIDEIPENLYTEVKRCDMDKARYILGRSKSKSMDDLRVKKVAGRRRVERTPESSGVSSTATQQQQTADHPAHPPVYHPATPLTLSLDSLDGGSQLSCPSTVEIADEEHAQEYYETIEDMYRDMALATARANQQLFDEHLETMSLPSTPRSSRSAGAALMSTRVGPLTPVTDRGHLGHYYMDTPYEANLLDHADVAL